MAFGRRQVLHEMGSGDTDTVGLLSTSRFAEPHQTSNGARAVLDEFPGATFGSEPTVAHTIYLFTK